MSKRSIPVPRTTAAELRKGDKIGFDGRSREVELNDPFSGKIKFIDDDKYADYESLSPLDALTRQISQDVTSANKRRKTDDSDQINKETSAVKEKNTRSKKATNSKEKTAEEKNLTTEKNNSSTPKIASPKPSESGTKKDKKKDATLAKVIAIAPPAQKNVLSHEPVENRQDTVQTLRTEVAQLTDLVHTLSDNIMDMKETMATMSGQISSLVEINRRYSFSELFDAPKDKEIQNDSVGNEIEQHIAVIQSNASWPQESLTNKQPSEQQQEPQQQQEQHQVQQPQIQQQPQHQLHQEALPHPLPHSEQHQMHSQNLLQQQSFPQQSYPQQQPQEVSQSHNMQVPQQQHQQQHQQQQHQPSFHLPQHQFQQFAPENYQACAPNMQAGGDSFNAWDQKWMALNETSDTRTQFCWKVVEKLFTFDELKGRCVNGGGTHKKLPLDPDKVSQLRQIVFAWRPLSHKESYVEAWRNCRQNIDSYLRKPKYYVAPK